MNHHGKQAQLTQPFSQDAVVWRVVAVSDDRHEAQVRPQLSQTAVMTRLDQVLGLSGWSHAYTLTPQAVACTLTLYWPAPISSTSSSSSPAATTTAMTPAITPVLAISRSAVVTIAPTIPASSPAAGVEPLSEPLLPQTPQLCAEDALVHAAEQFGLRPPVAQDLHYWVEYDADNGTILYEPEGVYEPERAVSVRAMMTNVVPGAAMAEAEAQESVASVDAANANANANNAGSDAGRPLTETADGNLNKSAGQQAIDKLIARLKTEGKGLDVAKLVMKYKGYGDDAQAARDLYSELRNLLQATLAL